ncbi:MAG: copper resistance protein CopC [Actinomycetota bacterium]|nr:copper resistance protein CopC [Actinomycetota bacterium]
MRRRILVIVLLALVALISGAPGAWAHAAFVSSRPEPGTQLATTPGVVEIEFSEPLIADLSSLVVTDPGGRRWQRTGVRQHSMRASVGTTTPGVYEVEWKTVSPVDGHALRGSYLFGVGVTPTDVEAPAPFAPQATDLLLAVARAVEYAGLLTAVGGLLVGCLARREPKLGWVREWTELAFAVALIAGIVVVVGEALLAAPSPTAGAMARYLSAEPGVPRLGRLAATATALVATRFGARGISTGAAAAAIAALAAGGHAAAARPPWWGVTVDALHLLAAGLWAGGVLVLATLRPPGGWRGQEARRLLERFSPAAAWAFVATVAFGILRGAQELAGIGDLVATSYGQVLSLKIVAVVLMLPLSLHAWRRRHARPRAEGALAVLAIAAAALLAAYPVPPGRAAEDAQAEVPITDPSLPQTGDLTLGGDTGDVLVGLTLRPGRPGRNDVYVHLVPAGGEEEAATLSAEILVGDEAFSLDPCGAPCRHTTAVVEDGDVLRVRVAGSDGPPARFVLPDLPAPDGQGLLDELNDHMARVDSLRYEEVLGPLDPRLRSTVEIVAPDRIDFRILTLDRETIRIGKTFYQRRGDGGWEVEQGGPSVEVPSYIWDYPDKVAPRIIGTERVDAETTDVVSFFIDHSSGPIWYRLWVDDEGLVRRAEMRARGHFMDHRYYDFGAPITIKPPVPSPGQAEGGETDR